MMKPILIISLMICLGILAAPAPVMAETFFGVLGGTTSASTAYTITDTGTSAEAGTFLKVYTIENTLGLQSMVLFPTAKMTFTAGAPASNHTPFKAYTYPVATAPYFTGEIGYQRVYDSGGTEQAGYMWITTNDYNTNMSLYTGDLLFNLDYNATDVYNMKSAATHPVATGQTAFMNSASSARSGSYSFYRSESVSNTYSVTKPGGLGIAGNITKPTGNPSRAYIYNATNNAILSSQSGITNDTFTFNLPNAATVFLGIKTSMGVMYNTSVFWSLIPVTTPAPTPTLPSGWPRTTVYTRDSNTNAQITGTTINIFDIENVSWKNSTADADGILFIDTPVYHTLNIYCTDPGGGYTPSSELAAVSGGNYYMPMVPVWSVAPAGWVNLFVNVYDAADRLSVPYANVNTRLPTGATEGTSTGISGTASFVVPNSTVVIITVSKSGYQTTGKTITTPVSGDQSTNINIARLVVTVVPTATVVPGEVTVRPTVLPGCEDPTSSACALAQDQNMMATVRTFAPTLITIACLMTLLYLMGWKP